MDLNVKVHALDQRVNRAETDITEQERIIRLSLQKLEQVKSKTFVQRYLRQ
jgi:hypothetical protein